MSHPYLFLLLLLVIFLSPPGALSEEGKETLQVFYIPHSHQDCGWLYTIEEYYEGYYDYEGNYLPGVGTIYTTVIQMLSTDPSRRFIVVEILFFKKWWEQQEETVQGEVRRLVSEKQLEFVLGGFCMSDEASVDHYASILSLTLGHLFLKETFGVVPRDGWQVDPFGASSATPVFLSMMGFRSHVVSRVDYRIKEEFQRKKALEFEWMGSLSLPRGRQALFTHMMDEYLYCTPWFVPGVYFNNPWLMPPVNETNISEISQSLVENIRERAQWIRTKHLLYPWG